MTASPALLDQLMRHEDFVRGTLRGLLASDSEVDDAVQDTWLGFLRRPARALRDPRTWFARAAKNHAISQRRSAARRGLRDRAKANESRTAESPEQTLLRAETRQRVAAVVLALEEPYRSVTLLRYAQDQSVNEIAGQLQRSPATVRSQLSRAHAILRSRLDAEFGDRRAWAALAVPLGIGKRAVPVPAVATAAAVLVVGGVLFALSSSNAAVAPPPAMHTGIAPSSGSPVSSASASAPATSAASALQRRSVADRQLQQAPTRERLLAAAVLLDQRRYDDYERATFSFCHGLRDDPDITITRNNWGVKFYDGVLSVRTSA